MAASASASVLTLIRPQHPSQKSGQTPLPVFTQPGWRADIRRPGALGVFATGWEPSPLPFPHFAARFKDDKDWQVVSIASGHDVMVDCPQELAAALIAAV
jgi:hypothetical protein